MVAVGLPAGTEPEPPFISLRARAPKLTLRAKGPLLPAVAEEGSSSIADSSKEPTLELETLSPRILADMGEPWLGEAPILRVLTERRRRLASAAAVVMGPWAGGLVPDDSDGRLLRLNMSVNA